MKRVLDGLKHLARSQDGQDLIEYGLTAALIAIVAVAAVSQVGSVVSNVLWNSIVQNF